MSEIYCSDCPCLKERPIGHWIELKTETIDDSFFDYSVFECSNCHTIATYVKNCKAPYCWNCGAKMKD